MLLKGTQIAVTGEINLRAYKAKDGTEKSSLECRVNDVTLLGKSEKPSQKLDVIDSFDDLPSEDIPF